MQTLKQPVPDTTDAIVARLLPQVVSIVSGELERVPNITVMPGDAQAIASCLARSKVLREVGEASVPSTLRKINISGKIQVLAQAFASAYIDNEQVYRLFTNAPKLFHYKTPNLIAKINIVSRLVHFDNLGAPFGVTTSHPVDALPLIMRENVFAELVATKQVQMHRASLVVKLSKAIAEKNGGEGRTLSGALRMTSDKKLEWILSRTTSEYYGRFRTSYQDARIAKPAHLKKASPQRPTKTVAQGAGTPLPPK